MSARTKSAGGCVTKSGDIGVGFSIGPLGPSYNRARLGNAFSDGTGGSQTGGVTVGATLLLGSSTVTKIKMEDCDCGK